MQDASSRVSKRDFTLLKLSKKTSIESLSYVCTTNQPWRVVYAGEGPAASSANVTAIDEMGTTPWSF